MPKFDTYLSYAVKIAAITPILMIAGAYMHTNYYYSAFGINTRDFFSIEDYLSASIATLIAVAIALLPYVIPSAFSTQKLFGINEEDAENFRNELMKSKRARFIRNAIVFFVIIVLLFTTILAFLKMKPYFFSIFFFMLLFLTPITVIIAVKFFDNSKTASFVMIASVLFIFLIYAHASVEIYKVHKKINSGDCMGLDFFDNKKIQISDCEYVLLGINSNFVFIANKNEKFSIAIDHDLSFQKRNSFTKTDHDYPEGLMNLRNRINKNLPF